MSARTLKRGGAPLGRVKTLTETSWMMSVAFTASTRIREIVPDVPLGVELARTLGAALGDELGPVLGPELGAALGPELGIELGIELG